MSVDTTAKGAEPEANETIDSDAIRANLARFEETDNTSMMGGWTE